MRNPVVERVALLAFVLAGSGWSQGVKLGVRLAENGWVDVSVSAARYLPVREVMLYRSSSRLSSWSIDTLNEPVAVLRFSRTEGLGVLVDSMVAHNVKYYYRAEVRLLLGIALRSGLDSVVIPDREIGRITGSSLLVDKRHYFLEVRDGGRMKKRFPIALGKKPRQRKLCMDRASTPEGIYRIVNEQPRAKYYKAFDLDYPNEVDRARYELAKEVGLIRKREGDYPGIGGEVQIHGEGIQSNWTWGCIALRNSDMDELFEHRRVGKGMPVHIVGSELTVPDLSSILDYLPKAEVKEMQRQLKRLGLFAGEPDGEVGKKTRMALGRFQRRKRIPMTCDFDCRTVGLLRGAE